MIMNSILFKGNTEIMKFLIERGANVNVVPKTDKPLIYLAVASSIYLSTFLDEITLTYLYSI